MGILLEQTAALRNELLREEIEATVKTKNCKRTH
jgi:hypothetical protein